MSEKPLLPTLLITGLVTALAVSTYYQQTSISQMEAQIEEMERLVAERRSAELGIDLEILNESNPFRQAMMGNASGTTSPAGDNGNKPDNWIYGNPVARFTLLELTDTECPYCRDHFPLVQTLVEASGGNINAALVHVPVQGEASRRQAVAVECAGDQGGSEAAWKMMSTILESTQGNGKGISQPTPLVAAQLGLDQQRFIACTESVEVIDRITSDLETAKTLGIAQTPSTLVYDNQTSNSVLLQGAYASSDGIIDAIEKLTIESAGAQQ